MRLYAGKIPVIAQDIISELSRGQDVELGDEQEAKLDIEAVLKEQLRMEKEVSDEAKSRMEARGLSYSELGRVRSQVAKERMAKTGEDVLPHLIEQMLHMLFHSKHVEEVFAEDATLRKKLTTILRRHMDVESELDQQVRAKIKNLEEGTSTFDVEYARAMEQLKRRRGLS